MCAHFILLLNTTVTPAATYNATFTTAVLLQEHKHTNHRDPRVNLNTVVYLCIYGTPGKTTGTVRDK